MPIFSDDLGNGQGARTPPTKPGISTLSNSPLDETKITRKVSEESIRTDLCEGPLLDDPEEDHDCPAADSTTGFAFPSLGRSDRVELIQRLKRGQNPAWFPNRNLGSALQEYDYTTPTKPSLAHSNSSLLLPSADISETSRTHTLDVQHTQAGLEIERPRSALHSGDFTERESQGDSGSQLYAGRPPSPWLSTSPPRNFSPFQLDTRFPPADSLDRTHSQAPSLSSSYSSSFVLKPPTSPLVQSESNEDIDFSINVNAIDITPQFQRNPRRHTLQASGSIPSTPSVPTAASFNRPLPHLRRDATYPYQAHQPRRSLASNPPTSQVGSSPQTPAFSRRPSYTSDSSPLQMVGSYEESILRGRMSTTPSKPLNFLAQIGVLGLGKSVFYSYETTSHGRAGQAEEGPSPYVGQIDLENNLPNLDEAREGKRKRHVTNPTRSHTDDHDVDVTNTNHLSEREIRRAEKQKRRSTSPRAPPGGSYRIPEKGQLQIIIKNPNKTAVKLFLVPYDLADGKEKLRNEIQLPEPRFSVYKPGRDSSLGLGLISGAGASLAAEKASRRRSAGFALGASQRNIDAMDGISQALEKGFSGASSILQGGEASTTPIQPIPFSIYRRAKRSGDDEAQRPPNIQSPTSSKSSRPPTSQGSGTSMSWTSDTASFGAYDKLNKGDIGYGGNVFGGSPDRKHGVPEGLLAQKLRNLGVDVPSQQDHLDGM
ncbi:hypothetical protein D0Z07_4495 [Hyphodiscus hymeniophilus]|uniref:Atos-like conserved domain-containing protein n=1 Tax=Hyphodiscus hymeniophilus TaxID=353542 RepID=A0A9P7AXP5_9HELO|nr:hypothetical protein D0Z07_4495 [Hyphodiscus hymeniophilus]